MGILNNFYKDTERTDESKIEAFWAVSNIAIDSEWCAQAIFEHRIIEKVLVGTLDTNPRIRSECLFALCNLITTVSYDYLQSHLMLS